LEQERDRTPEDALVDHLQRVVGALEADDREAAGAAMAEIAFSPAQTERRPSLTPRLQAEVFRRDAFTCRYCGARTVPPPVLRVLSALFPVELRRGSICALHDGDEVSVASRVGDGESVRKEVGPLARLLDRGPNGVDLVVLVEVVSAGRRCPWVGSGFLDLEVSAISQISDVNHGDEDLRVVAEVHPLAVLVDGLPANYERPSRAVGLETEEFVDDDHQCTHFGRG